MTMKPSSTKLKQQPNYNEIQRRINAAKVTPSSDLTLNTLTALFVRIQQGLAVNFGDFTGQGNTVNANGYVSGLALVPIGETTTTIDCGLNFGEVAMLACTPLQFDPGISWVVPAPVGQVFTFTLDAPCTADFLFKFMVTHKYA